MYKARANISDGKNTVMKGDLISDTVYNKLNSRQKAKFIREDAKPNSPATDQEKAE